MQKKDNVEKLLISGVKAADILTNLPLVNDLKWAQFVSRLSNSVLGLQMADVLKEVNTVKRTPTLFAKKSIVEGTSLVRCGITL